LANFFVQAVIEKWNSEGSAGLLSTGGPDPNAMPTTIRGCRWIGTNVAADGKFIVFALPGPLTVAGNYFEALNPSNPVELQIAFFPPLNSNMWGSVIHEGNSYKYVNPPTRSALVDYTSSGASRIR